MEGDWFIDSVLVSNRVKATKCAPSVGKTCEMILQTCCSMNENLVSVTETEGGKKKEMKRGALLQLVTGYSVPTSNKL